MSESNSGRARSTTSRIDASDEREWPDDYRDEIEREANSDGPHAWVCQRILSNLEDGGNR